MDERAIEDLIQAAIEGMPLYAYNMDGSMCFNVNDPKRTLYRRVCTETGETWAPAPTPPSANPQQSEKT